MIIRNPDWITDQLRLRNRNHGHLYLARQRGIHAGIDGQHGFPLGKSLECAVIDRAYSRIAVIPAVIVVDIPVRCRSVQLIFVLGQRLHIDIDLLTQHTGYRVVRDRRRIALNVDHHSGHSHDLNIKLIGRSVGILLKMNHGRADRLSRKQSGIVDCAYTLIIHPPAWLSLFDRLSVLERKTLVLATAADRHL